MLRDVLVHLANGVSDDAALDYAVSLAQAFEAHLAGAAFADEIPPALILNGAPPEWLDRYRAEARDSAKSAVARCEAAAKRAGISVQAGWMPTPVTGAANLFARIARRFDLSVVRQADPGKDSLAPLIIEAALFETGRPALVVPCAQKAGLALDRVMIGWDGSASATRAIGDAMPFLQRAKAVQLVTVVGHGNDGELAGAEIAQHLGRHRVPVEVKEIVAPNVKPAAALLSHAAETAADLMVIGGYGHSRLREFVLGGVTRSVLAATTVPTLMSH
jgi:nucleotide-binding universal stress UspA family protein